MTVDDSRDYHSCITVSFVGPHKGSAVLGGLTLVLLLVSWQRSN